MIIYFWQRHSSVLKGHRMRNTAGWNLLNFKFLTTFFRRKNKHFLQKISIIKKPIEHWHKATKYTHLWLFRDSSSLWGIIPQGLMSLIRKDKAPQKVCPQDGDQFYFPHLWLLVEIHWQIHFKKPRCLRQRQLSSWLSRWKISSTCTFIESSPVKLTN